MGSADGATATAASAAGTGSGAGAVYGASAGAAAPQRRSKQMYAPGNAGRRQRRYCSDDAVQALGSGDVHSGGEEGGRSVNVVGLRTATLPFTAFPLLDLYSRRIAHYTAAKYGGRNYGVISVGRKPSLC